MVRAMSLALLMAAGSLNAQEQVENPDDVGELTITLITDAQAALPNAVTRTIRLPMPATEQGVTSSAAGVNTAAEARERGAEFGADVAETSRELRESVGRGDFGDSRDGPEAVPGTVPESPELPEAPNPPSPPSPPGD
jgi:hypothetical protein